MLQNTFVTQHVVQAQRYEMLYRGKAANSFYLHQRPESKKTQKLVTLIISSEQTLPKNITIRPRDVGRGIKVRQAEQGHSQVEDDSRNDPGGLTRGK